MWPALEHGLLGGRRVAKQRRKRDAVDALLGRTHTRKVDQRPVDVDLHGCSGASGQQVKQLTSKILFAQGAR